MKGTLIERLAPKVLVGDGCWEWSAARNQYGYGLIGRGRRGEGSVLAHRAVYELLVGPIPEGLTLDHLCRNRCCVRPSHLEPVTLAENKARGMSPGAMNARKTHCTHGHEFTAENTYMYRGWRQCRTCIRAKDANRVPRGRGKAA